MATSVKRVLDSILASLLNKLGSDGFVKGGDLTLIRSTPESVFALNLQPDKYNRKFEGKFAVNVTLWYPALAREREESHDHVPNRGGLHLQERLAMLGPPPAGSSVPIDHWWDVNESTDSQALFESVYSLWESHGRQWLAENESLGQAIPRLVIGRNGYDEATALYAVGDVAGAKEAARAIWREGDTTYRELIEWAWRRELFSLNDLVEALADENNQARLSALSSLWTIASSDAQLTSYARGVANHMVNDSDAEVAHLAGRMVESFFERNGVFRLVPAEVPDLGRLPKNAIVAFAARCARRVENRIAATWSAVKDTQLETVSAVLSTVEEIAAGKRPRSDGKTLVKRIGPVWSAARRAAAKSPQIEFAVAAVDAARWAATAFRGDAVSGEVAARMSTYAIPENELLKVRAAIWEDFDRLDRLSISEGWSNETPVTVERLQAE